MSIWGRIAERMRGKSAGAARAPPEGEVGRTYADLESDKARKEAMMSGEGFTAGAGTGDFGASRTGGDEPVRGSDVAT